MNLIIKKTRNTNITNKYDNLITKFIVYSVYMIGLSLQGYGLMWLISQKQRNLARLEKKPFLKIFTTK